LIFRKLVIPLLLLGWLVVTSPPLLLLIWLEGTHKAYARVVPWVGFPLFLAWLPGGFWLAMTTARHMFVENRLFLTAVRYTLSDLRLMLACMPIIGGLFMPDEDKTHNQDDDA
jgi:hypothetical protein